MSKLSLKATLLLLLAALGAKAQYAELLTTTGSRNQDLARTDVAIETNSSTTDAIVLKPDKENQSIDGYGYAITYSSCYNLLKMDKALRHSLLKKTYSPGAGYGVSYARISIGCSDFSSTEYSLCDTRGLQNFRFHSDETNYVIPILKEILAINPNLKIIASPWTCPKWMKVDNINTKNAYDSWTSGHLNPDYYDDYAEYFVKFINAMKAEGINIYAVTPQNEPLNQGNCASLYMPWKEEAAFVKVLAQTFHNESINTKIYLFDHNYNYDGQSDQNDYPIKVYNELGQFEGSELVVGAAYHNYGGDPSELNDIHWQNTNKELIFSEASIGTWNEGRNLDSSLMDNMKNVAISTALNYCRAAVVWNFMLDMNRGPNLDGGCQTCFGAVDVANDYKSYTLNSHYYIMAHMSFAVKPGAKRIDTEGWWTNNLSYAAFKNPDGSLAIVFCNENSSDLSVKVSDGSHLITVPVPARGVVSCRFNNPTPTFNSQAMTYEKDGVYSYTGTLEQGKKYTFGGRQEFKKTGWFSDGDFFLPSSDGSYRFQALTGTYKVIADFNQGCLRVYPVADDAPATISDGGIWVIGSEGVGKPLYLWNGKNWWSDADHALAMSQTSKDIYQLTLTAGQQLNASDVNFKFFGQAGWGTEFTPDGTTHKISTSDSNFGIGTGTNGHDNGNIYSNSTLEYGKKYTFILDCRNGFNNAELIVADDSQSSLTFKALPTNMEGDLPYTYLRTFSSDRAWQLPNGVDAYVVRKYENGVAYLKKIDFIPANTGVILGTNDGSFFILDEYADPTAGYSSRNLLVPTVESTLIAPSVIEDGTIVKRNYMFAYHRDNTTDPFKLGFWRTAEGWSGENRAYLSLDANDTDDYTKSVDDGDWDEEAYSKVVVMSFNYVTGIAELNTARAAKGIYTLQGVRVDNPSQPGLYISNGKKFIRK